MPKPLRPSGPRLLRRVVNFAVAGVSHVASGCSSVSDSIYEERLAQCRSCSSCDLERLVCLEPSCGCQLEVKARWSTADCPLGRWRRLESQSRKSTDPPPD